LIDGADDIENDSVSTNADCGLLAKFGEDNAPLAKHVVRMITATYERIEVVFISLPSSIIELQVDAVGVNK
jgi:hypothetical protein